MNTRDWRTPAVILLCGGMALTIAMGVVSAILNWPVDDRAIERAPAPRAAA